MTMKFEETQSGGTVTAEFTGSPAEVDFAVAKYVHEYMYGYQARVQERSTVEANGVKTVFVKRYANCD